MVVIAVLLNLAGGVLLLALALLVTATAAIVGAALMRLA